MEPGAPAVPMEGSAEIEMVLGGRYLEQRYRGSFLGQSFEGRAMEGYDNVTGEFFSAWFDTMSTGLFLSRGKQDGQRNAVDYLGTHADPMTGDDVVQKSRTEVIDKDHFRIEMWTQEDGNFRLTMRADYRRAG